jgi:ubiquinone/menaquinone biosynthesis C-methylase UbiE
MPATYDHIGAQYEEYANSATLKRAERHTFLELVGSLHGERVLDVACGFGYYTRLLKQQGAGAVVGSDVSPEMIRLAREREAADPAGVEYVVADGAALPDLPPCDLVTGVWILNYAGSVERLRSMLRDVHDRLRPGGRFVTITINPAFDLRKGNMTRYGIEVLSDAPDADPPKLVGRFMTDPPSDDVLVDHWSRQTYASAFRSAGFGEIAWEPLRVSAELVAEFGAAYWQDLLRNSIATAIVARRP